MSTFLIQCPDCGIELEVDKQYIGRNAVCSICQYRFVIQNQNMEQANSNIEKQTKDDVADVSRTEPKGSCPGNTDLKPRMLDKKSEECKLDDGDTEKDLPTGTLPSSQNKTIPEEKAFPDITKPKISPRSRLAAFLKKVEEEDVTDIELEEEVENFVKLPAENKKETMSVNKVGKTIVQKCDRNADTVLEYTLPPVGMLSIGNDAIGESPETIQKNCLTIQRTLDSFRVSGRVVGHIVGPRTTRYEISLANGVNINKFMRLENTFAMKLGVSNISLLSSLPGTDAVGIEIPNTHPQTVFMRNVVETKQWKKSKAAIPVVIGKNFSNEPIVIDLAQAPHLLLAGSTGSGKSVCLDTLIISLLFKFSPDELRLIMFDPNRIDFANYSWLPHLLTPIINKATKVVYALRWVVTEMESRYKLLAAAGVKNLAAFNALSRGGDPIRDKDGKTIVDSYGSPICKMPFLIVIINEFAELRNQESWLDVENYIERITKSGRVAGVHIVMATQRPSVDIISGKIKANFPARIAFRVPQNIDSRVILDQPGAEKLFGKGDMLARLPGIFGLERIQGALIEDCDIKAIIQFVSSQQPQNFEKGIEDEEEISDKYDSFSSYGSIDDYDIFDDMDRAEITPLVKKYLQPGDDEIMRKALEVVILDRKASTSYIQRRLKIGYNRAAELIDLMEERGIVGPPSGSGNKREVLVFNGIEINESSDADNYAYASDDEDDDDNYAYSDDEDDDDNYAYSDDEDVTYGYTSNDVKQGLGCLMYCIIAIIAFAFFMDCTASVGIALFFMLAVPWSIYRIVSSFRK